MKKNADRVPVRVPSRIRRSTVAARSGSVRLKLPRLCMLSIEYLPERGRPLIEDVCFRPIPTMKPNYFRKTIHVVPYVAQG